MQVHGHHSINEYLLNVFPIHLKSSSLTTFTCGIFSFFQEFAENFLSKLNETWPGFDLEIEKVVADTTDVCVFVNITADGLSAKSIHHFVVQDGLEVEFNIYDDSQNMADAAH